MTKFERNLVEIEANFDMPSSENVCCWGLDILRRYRASIHLSRAVFIFPIGPFFLEIFAEENAVDFSGGDRPSVFEFKWILGGERAGGGELM